MVEGELTGRVIRVRSRPTTDWEHKDGGRQWTGECKCENRHIRNQADSWAAHWQEAPWMF